jgi:hypothetical protein
VFNTVTVTRVIVNAPPTVTIVQQDPSSVAQSMASVDTDQVIEQSELLPISDTPDPTPTAFTDSVIISGYVATVLTDDGASVFYMSVGPSSTDWSYTPSASPILVDVTTVTVLPVPQNTNTNLREAPENTTTATHLPFTSPLGGWNATGSNYSVWASGIAASGTGASGTGASYHPTSTVTITNIVATVTQTVAVSAAPSSPYIPPAYGSPGSSSVYGDDPAASSGDYGDYGDLDKRQTCVWITATIGGQQVGWCNNWGGSSTLTYTTWETTSKAQSEHNQHDILK